MGSLRTAAVALAVLVVGFSPGAAGAAVYSNTTPITIPDQGAASPYGTSIAVSGVPGLISRVGVELVGAEHGFPADVRVLLVGPAGTAWVLNRQGGFSVLPAGNLRIDSDSTARTFTDLVAPGVHAIEPERDPGATPMPGPAPPATYGASLRPLLGGFPNGTWTLYVTDEAAGAQGSIPGGWRLHLDTTVDDRLDRLDLAGSPAAVESAGTFPIHLYRKTAGAPLGARDVRVRSVDGTAKAGEDYVAFDRTVHFPSGAEETTFDVQLLDDAVTENPETFSVEYVDLPAGVAAPTDPLAPVTLVDNDGPAGAFAKLPSPLSMRETGGAFQIGPLEVIRTGDMTGPLEVTWQVLGGSASAADVATGSPINLPNRFNSLDIPAPVNDGSDEAPRETTTLILKLTASGAFVTTAPLTILDSQGAGILQVVRAGEGEARESDPSKGSVFVQREGGSFTSTETGTLTIAGGSAQQGVDYNPGSPTRNVTLNSGIIGSRADLNPGTAPDGVQEGTEEIRVTLAATSGGTTVDGARSAVNLPLLDLFSPPGYGGEIAPKTDASPSTEGTIIRIPVKRVGPQNTAISAQWSTHDVTGKAGRDYEAASGTVSWAAFETADKEIQVTTLQDSLVEGEERVGVTLHTPTISNPSLTIGLSPPTVEGRIADDDTTGPGQLDVDSDPLTVAEGDPVVVPVHRTLGRAGPVEVTCRVADGAAATPGADIQPSATATFADNALEGSCTLPTVADALDEPDETLKIELADPTNGAVVGPQSARDVTITDDDPPGSGPIRLGASEVTVPESAGMVPITLDRGPETTGDVNAVVALQPGSAGLSDATLATQRVTIPAGQASASVDLGVIDDTDDETDTEDLTVVLSDPQGGVSLGEPSSERIVITDNDGGGVASIVDGGRVLQVVENRGPARIVVTRRSGLAPGGGFAWSFVPGTAVNRDVGVRSGSVTFATGETRATIAVPIVNDSLLERNEQFRVVLTDPIGSLTLTAPTSRPVTILDDDGFAPVRVLTRRTRLDRRNRAAVRLGCPRKARRACVGRLTLSRKKSGKTVVFGRKRYSIKPDRKIVVRVQIPSRRLGLLPRGKRTRVSATARARSKAVPVVRRRVLIRRL